MANIRAQQAIYDIRNAWTKLLDAAKDLRELRSEYTEAGLLTIWQNNPSYFTDHGFTYATLVAALDDYGLNIDATIQANDANGKKARAFREGGADGTGPQIRRDPLGRVPVQSDPSRRRTGPCREELSWIAQGIAARRLGACCGAGCCSWRRIPSRRLLGPDSPALLLRGLPAARQGLGLGSRPLQRAPHQGLRRA
jgi:hypothetical protein